MTSYNFSIINNLRKYEEDYIRLILENFKSRGLDPYNLPEDIPQYERGLIEKHRLQYDLAKALSCGCKSCIRVVNFLPNETNNKEGKGHDK